MSLKLGIELSCPGCELISAVALISTHRRGLMCSHQYPGCGEGGGAQLPEYLPCMCDILGSIPTTIYPAVMMHTYNPCDTCNKHL